MKKISYADKLKYKFDNLMSKGTVALISALAIASVVVIALISLFVWLTNSSPDTGIFEIMWMCLMRTLDAGTMGGDEGSIMFLLSMFIITLAGIFILSILIGLLTTGIESKLDSLRKGRSVIIENDHTIILGWSDMIFTIIPELIEANKNQKNSCIVILGDKDKVEMEDEIKARIPSTLNTKIVCRQGVSADINDISIVSPQSSKSIIILGDTDSNIIKTLLAVLSYKSDREKPYNIVTRLMKSQNLEIGKIVGKGQVEFIQVENLISRIMVQTCLQPGLSAVFTELLDFGGDEIYICKEKGVIGKTFEQVQLMYDKSTVIGILSGNTVKVNPPQDTILTTEDKIIAISEDDDTVVLSGINNYEINESDLVNKTVGGISQAKILILGWNKNVINIVNELDSFVLPGSLVTIAAKYSGLDNEIKENCKEVKNLAIEYMEADINDRGTLNELSDKGYERIIVLAYEDMDIQEADGITLVALLHLRDIAEKKNLRFSVVSEILDVRNRDLAEVASVNDFIVSDRLVSLLMTQISENKHLAAVFEDIFDSDGSEIYIKNVKNYVSIDRPLNFYNVVKSASNRGEVAIGYKIASEEGNARDNYGIYINPRKQDFIHFTENDSIIVLSEN